MTEADNAMLEKAIEVAVVAHAGQTDNYGDAYILHLLRVMQALRDQGSSIVVRVAAMLHGFIEKCGVSDDFLADQPGNKYGQFQLK
jgi:(p)ppGpp synthase/HD superfamily hydrolase